MKTKNIFLHHLKDGPTRILYKFWVQITVAQNEFTKLCDNNIRIRGSLLADVVLFLQMQMQAAANNAGIDRICINYSVLRKKYFDNTMVLATKFMYHCIFMVHTQKHGITMVCVQQNLVIPCLYHDQYY